MPRSDPAPWKTRVAGAPVQRSVTVIVSLSSPVQSPSASMSPESRLRAAIQTRVRSASPARSLAERLGGRVDGAHQRTSIALKPMPLVRTGPSVPGSNEPGSSIIRAAARTRVTARPAVVPAFRNGRTSKTPVIPAPLAVASSTMRCSARRVGLDAVVEVQHVAAAQPVAGRQPGEPQRPVVGADGMDRDREAGDQRPVPIVAGSELARVVQVEGAGRSERLDQRLDVGGFDMRHAGELHLGAPAAGRDLVGDDLAEGGARALDEGLQLPAERGDLQAVGEERPRQREGDGHGPQPRKRGSAPIRATRSASRAS